MSVQIIQADARALPLADDSVDLVVTSPPYWSLRSYQDGGEHYDGQIGAEPTPAEYVDALIDCTREWMRVLKPSGSIWLNLGDKYSTYEGPRNVPQNNQAGLRQGTASQEGRRHTKSAPSAYGVPYKSLLGLPWRYAIRCIDELDLILRAEVIWNKPNGMPESATDRVRRSHETWFHFTQRGRYFSAVDEIREPPSGYSRPNGTGREARGGQRPRLMADSCNPKGRLPGSVWEIATQPLSVPDEIGTDHYAAFPLEWPLRIIKGWSPSGICTECGEGRRPDVSRQRLLDGEPIRGTRFGSEKTEAPNGFDHNRFSTDVRITGYVCACLDPTAPTRPSVVLDPFGGTGTTALAADVLGRHGISVDMSADYCEIARWRTTDPGERARAMGVPKPEPVPDGQTTLFEMESS